jgi:acetyl coenzyme A synthetase (ADP forming)-like protein
MERTTPSTRALDPIFSPRTIAVVGASRRRDSIGFSLLHNLVVSEFQGAIFPINPKADSIHSLKAYPSVSAVPDPIDLAVIIVPRGAVLPVVDECIAAGVRGLVVITAGFAETGEEGARLERALHDKVRQAGVRMIGPNCMGVINADPEVSMNATFAPTPASRGSVGFVSQSGALGVAILNAAADLGIGLTQFASIGNKTDVSGIDLLEYWEDDDETRVICMYLESFGNPRDFPEAAKRVGRKKPILIVKSGRTQEGARAASSHTGALAGRDVTVSTFLAQCGVLRAGSIEELFAVAKALNNCPLPAGDRVAVLTNAGGPAIIATDSLVNLNLQMAELSDTSRQRLSEFLPSEASVANPVDMVASATAVDYRRALEIILADEGVDMVLPINVKPLLGNPINVLSEIGAVVNAGASKPVLSVMMATEDFYDQIKLRPELPPVYRFPESAARALAQLSRYASWRRRPKDEAVPEFEVDETGVEEIIQRYDGGYLTAPDAFRVLESYGIPVVPWRWAADAAAVEKAARELGYPVAIKVEAVGLVHKSDIGAVRLGLGDAEEVGQAVRELQAASAEAGFQPSGFLVQRMAGSGHEVLFGVSTDPRFGPLLAFGLGGRYVEVFGDVRFGVSPLSPSEAREMIEGIRGFPLLAGVRGEAPADRDVLLEVLLRIAQLSQRHPRIEELDINPFLAAPAPDEAVAIDVRIRLGAPKSSGPAS